VPAIVSLRSKEILLYQMDGMLTKDEIHESLDLIFEAAKVVRQKQADALKEKYERIEETVASEKPSGRPEQEEEGVM